ncbi:MAG: methyltransferase domain-containing protein [Chromatiales bacterium]|nr:methyltransferase domain-containing protein [Chromatiales bacterium]
MFNFKQKRIARSASQNSLLLDEWYQSDVNRKLWAETEPALHPWLEKAVGYYAAHIAAFEVDTGLLAASRVRSQNIVNATRYPTSDLVADFSALPLATESIDLLVAHHIFEFISQPHEFLREIDRVLIAEGTLVVIAFNPISYQGLFKLFQFHGRANPPWCGHFYSPFRVKDWLSVLGFKVKEMRYFAPPLIRYKNHHGYLGKISRFCGRSLKWGSSFYAILATKQVSRIIPVGPIWNDSVVKPKIAQPTI